ncbi:hypothetical protein phiAS5_ORF0212 [Aeromonas phage phiAS5]|uniref:Uncharacterized protein n=1 Tax=Aeromonas phage phiAS5 TaxID=879630 RepID=E1A2V9_9CAUD|nr:hypothetical protein phiAS5_ORF0212 [Aeromonas phage phiAS5]ADM80055.1 hypothetical protein phiAS5_ORF0212 [Aeromonas phage phiAS5]
MTSGELKAALKSYLKENLDISVSTNKGQIVVEITIEDEIIASSSEYICDILNEKDNW